MDCSICKGFYSSWFTRHGFVFYASNLVILRGYINALDGYPHLSQNTEGIKKNIKEHSPPVCLLLL